MDVSCCYIWLLRTESRSPFTSTNSSAACGEVVHQISTHPDCARHHAHVLSGGFSLQLCTRYLVVPPHARRNKVLLSELCHSLPLQKRCLSSFRVKNQVSNVFPLAIFQAAICICFRHESMSTSAREHTQHYIVPTKMFRFPFRRTKMMARYDTRACDGSFGNGLVDAWRRTGTECCQPPEALADGPDASSIHCHLIHQVGGDFAWNNRTYTF